MVRVLLMKAIPAFRYNVFEKVKNFVKDHFLYNRGCCGLHILLETNSVTH